MSNKIDRIHLSRKAYVYIRQSSTHQVLHNTESQMVQYNLIDRARTLGWDAQHVVVIDEDLGTSAAGSSKRNGFKELLQAICSNIVGALFFLYASRLARNKWEWHQVLEVCSLFNTLIVDREQIYNPALSGDRLLLGMQGSFSEYEGKQMQIRSQEALQNKAARGQLFRLLPAGFVKSEDQRIELDPNQRVQHAIESVFQRFESAGSIRQVYNWFLSEELPLPVRQTKDGPSRIEWRPPAYSTVHSILTNPLYAGIYQYPRTKTIIYVDDDGHLFKRSGHRLNEDDKVVLIEDLFPGYISKEQFNVNQQRIAANANMKGKMVQGAPRTGSSLLAGLLHCGKCGRKLRVRYSQKGSPTYCCSGEHGKAPHGSCFSFRGRLLEEYVQEQMLATLQPEAIRAALITAEKMNQNRDQKAQALSDALEQAQYEAGRIDRQIKAVEPENLLVLRTLSQRWEAALQQVEKLDERYQQAKKEQTPLSQEERQRLFELADDLQKLWEHPNCDAALKVRLVRILIREIWIAESDDRHLKATIYWQGGVHTEYHFRHSRRTASREDVKDQRPLEQLIGELAAVCDDAQIARILNRLKYRTATQKNWSESIVAQYRREYHITSFSNRESPQENMLTLCAAAQQLKVSCGAVKTLIRKGILNAKQVIKYAPWQIQQSELRKPEVKKWFHQSKNDKIPFHLD